MQSLFSFVCFEVESCVVGGSVVCCGLWIGIIPPNSCGKLPLCSGFAQMPFHL